MGNTAINVRKTAEKVRNAAEKVQNTAAKVQTTAAKVIDIFSDLSNDTSINENVVFNKAKEADTGVIRRECLFTETDTGVIHRESTETDNGTNAECLSNESAGICRGTNRSRIVSTCGSDAYNEEVETHVYNHATESKNEKAIDDLEKEAVYGFSTAMVEEVKPAMDELVSSEEPIESDCERERGSLFVCSSEMELHLDTAYELEICKGSECDEDGKYVNVNPAVEGKMERPLNAESHNWHPYSEDHSKAYCMHNTDTESERIPALGSTTIEGEAYIDAILCGSPGPDDIYIVDHYETNDDAETSELTQDITNSSDTTEDEGTLNQSFELYCLENNFSDDVSTEMINGSQEGIELNEHASDTHENDSDFVADYIWSDDTENDDEHCDRNTGSCARELSRLQISSTSFKSVLPSLIYLHTTNQLSWSLPHYFCHNDIIEAREKYTRSNENIDSMIKQLSIESEAETREPSFNLNNDYTRQMQRFNEMSTDQCTCISTKYSTESRSYRRPCHNLDDCTVQYCMLTITIHTPRVFCRVTVVLLKQQTTRNSWYMLYIRCTIISKENDVSDFCLSGLEELFIISVMGNMCCSETNTICQYAQNIQRCPAQFNHQVTTAFRLLILSRYFESLGTATLCTREYFMRCSTTPITDDIRICDLTIESLVETKPSLDTKNETEKMDIFNDSARQLQHLSEVSKSPCTSVKPKCSTESNILRSLRQIIDDSAWNNCILKVTICTIPKTSSCQTAILFSSLQTRNSWYLLYIRCTILFKEHDVPDLSLRGFGELFIVSVGRNMCCSETNVICHYAQNIQRCPAQLNHQITTAFRQGIVLILNRDLESLGTATLCTREYVMPCNTSSMTDNRRICKKYDFWVTEALVETKPSLVNTNNGANSWDIFDDSVRQIQQLSEVATSSCTSDTQNCSTENTMLRNHCLIIDDSSWYFFMFQTTICRNRYYVSCQTLLLFLQTRNTWHMLYIRRTITFKQIGIPAFSFCGFGEVFMVSIGGNSCCSMTNKQFYNAQNIHRIPVHLNYNIKSIVRQGGIILQTIFNVINEDICSREKRLTAHCTLNAVRLRCHLIDGMPRQRTHYKDIELMLRHGIEKHCHMEYFMCSSAGSVAEKRNQHEKFKYLTELQKLIEKLGKIHDLETDGITEHQRDETSQIENDEIADFDNRGITSKSREMQTERLHQTISLCTNKEMKDTDVIKLGNTEPIPSAIESKLERECPVHVVHRNDGADIHFLPKRTEDSSNIFKMEIRIHLEKGAKLEGQIGQENRVLTVNKNGKKDLLVSRSNGCICGKRHAGRGGKGGRRHACRGGKRHSNHTMTFKIQRAVLQTGQPPQLLIFDRTFKDQNHHEKYNECKTNTGVTVVSLECAVVNLYVKKSIIIQNGDNNVCVGVSSQHLENAHLDKIMSQAELFESISDAREGDTAITVRVTPSKSLLSRICKRNVQGATIKGSRVRNVSLTSAPDIGDESDLECDITPVFDEPLTQDRGSQSIRMKTLKEMKVDRCSKNISDDELCLGAGWESCCCHQLQPASNQRCGLQKHEVHQYSCTDWEAERESVQNIVNDRLAEIGFVKTLESVGMKRVYHLAEVMIFKSEVLVQANLKVFVKKAILKGLQGLKHDAISDFDPAIDVDVKIVQCGYI